MYIKQFIFGLPAEIWGSHRKNQERPELPANFDSSKGSYNIVSENIDPVAIDWSVWILS